MSLSHAPVDPSQFLARTVLPVVDHAGSVTLKLAKPMSEAITTATAINQTIQRRSASSLDDTGALVRAERTRRLPGARKTKRLMRSIMPLFYFAAQQKRRRAFTGRLFCDDLSDQYLVLSTDFCAAK